MISSGRHYYRVLQSVERQVGDRTRILYTLKRQRTFEIVRKSIRYAIPDSAIESGQRLESASMPLPAACSGSEVGVFGVPQASDYLVKQPLLGGRCLPSGAFLDGLLVHWR